MAEQEPAVHEVEVEVADRRRESQCIAPAELNIGDTEPRRILLGKGQHVGVKVDTNR